MDLIKKYEEVRKKEEENDRLEALEHYKMELSILNDLINEAFKNERTLVHIEDTFVRCATVDKLGFETSLFGTTFTINRKGLRKLQKELKKYKLN